MNITTFSTPTITVHVSKDSNEKLPYKLVEKTYLGQITLTFSTLEECMEKFHDFVDNAKV